MKYFSILLFVLVACNTAPAVKETAASANPVAKKHLPVTAGLYDETALAISTEDTITGAFEYYDAWSDKYKAYMRVCKFYFKGKLRGDSVAAIDASWPGSDQHMKGTLKFWTEDTTRKMSMVLDDIPYGYAQIDFEKEGEYVRALGEARPWIKIGIVQAEKCRLYNGPDTAQMQRAYIVEGDIVKVLEQQGDWCHIEYSAPNSSKSLFAWIREEDLSGSSALKVSAQLIYDDGSLADFDAFDKTKALWNVVAAGGDAAKPSNSTKISLMGNLEGVNVLVRNGKKKVVDTVIAKGGPVEYVISGTGCMEVYVTVTKSKKLLYNDTIPFRCGE